MIGAWYPERIQRSCCLEVIENETRLTVGGGHVGAPQGEAIADRTHDTRSRRDRQLGADSLLAAGTRHRIT